MTDKKKPWQKTLKDYLYKAVPSKIKKIKKLASSLKNIDMLDNPNKALKKEGLKIDKKTGKVKKITTKKTQKKPVENEADKAMAEHRRRKVVDIRTKGSIHDRPKQKGGQPQTGQGIKPKQKPKPTSKKDKLITGAALGAGGTAAVGLYKSGEKSGEYKERQKMHDKDLEDFRKKQQRLKEKSREKKKKPLNLNKKNRGVWV